MVCSDQHLYHRWQTAANSNEWSTYPEGRANWNSLWGQFSLKGRPAAAKNADGRLEVFMVMLDRQLYTVTQKVANDSTRDAWTNWIVLGGQWSSLRRPAIATNADGRLEVFMRDADRKLQHLWQLSPSNSIRWSENWNEFSPERWPLSSDPAIERNADGRLEVFMVGSDRQLYHRWQTAANSNVWSDGWTTLGGQFL
jgi:hypothetical protein